MGGMIMKFVLIFGPQAVGKMTVGQELEKITELKLFHKHMSIEFVTPRLERNRSENRLLHKPTKRDIGFSERNLRIAAEKSRLNSNDGEITNLVYRLE
jgi:hypothetical protein